MTLATETNRQIDWPQEDLEYLGACPACQQPERHLVFTNLTDRVSGVAPGAWTLWRCNGCGAVYLDPRPSPDSIGRAYEIYYTHTSSVSPRSGWGEQLRARIRTVLFNGYLNQQFGYLLKPSSTIGGYLYGWRPGRAGIVSDYIRSLPPPTMPGARLLEIGPGNGGFLHIAKRLGYVVEGLEPDPKAVEVCRQSGFHVREGSIPQTALPENAFEQILLNHVFEHLHYPAAALDAIWKALTPGGRLWMSMPNLQASGLQRWGRNWMALDPPRHLVLYDCTSLEQLLRRFNFLKIEVISLKGGRDYIYPASRKIEQGEIVSASSDLAIPVDVARQIERDDKAQDRDPTIAETFAIIAYKPVRS